MAHLTPKSILAALLLLLPLAAMPVSPAAANNSVPKRFFATEADAQRGCGSDTVVWANKNTEVYHLNNSHWYGKTKDGAFGCRTELDRAGYHASKVEK